MSEAIRSITQAVHQVYGRTRAGRPSALQKLFSTIGVNIHFNPLSALKALQKKELLIQDGDQYLIHDILLARWLQRL
ncbi:MAG TPA: hypothetical protein VIR29_01115 [Anseongella sp.]